MRILTREHVRRAVDMAGAIEAMRSAFAQLSDGRARIPRRLALATPGGQTLYMPGYLEEGPALGGKVVSVFPDNPRRGLPAVTGVVLLLDPETGEPRALMDGTWLTTLRTGAASGLATDLLARADARVLAVFGAGAQARGQVEAVRTVRAVEEVRIVSRTRSSAETLAGEIRDVTARVFEDRRRAVEGADVVVTATDSETPVFEGRHVAPGTHVNAIGSYRPDMRELDARLMSRARVVVDSREAAWSEAGELCLAKEEGVIGDDAVDAELGEVVAGERPGRTTEEEVTVFKSVGSAAQDLAVAARVLEAAERKGLGVRVEL